MADYDASSITVLKGHEAVRRRPGMYVGDVADGSGMHELLWNFVNSAFGEHLDGTATFIRVQVEGDTILVEDDGPGLPVHPVRGEPEVTALEAAFTRLHCGGSLIGFDLGERKHGRRWDFDIGFAVANFLSAWLEVTVWRDGRTYKQRHERGVPCGPVTDFGPTSRSGTRILFSPDFSIFSHRAWDLDAIASRLRELAALGRTLTTICQHQVFRAPDGLADHARFLAGSRRPIHPRPIRLRGSLPDLDVEVALQWTESDGTETIAFVNGRPSDEGTHIRGVATGVLRAFRRLLPDRLHGVHPSAFREAIERGRMTLVHVVMADALFMGCRGRELVSIEAHDAVSAVVAIGLARELTNTPGLRARLAAALPGH